MKKTIKYKVLEFVSTNGMTTRQELMFAVFRAQGKKGKEAKTPRSGYYSVNFKQWVDSGVLTRMGRGKYMISDKGIKYLENPKQTNLEARLKKTTRRVNYFEEKYYEVLSELRTANYKLAEIRSII